jgi:hypothetical protein
MDATDIEERLSQRELKEKEDEATRSNTGLDREVVVSSPSCKKKTSRQPDIHFPRYKQTAPSKTTTSITWPL